MNGQLTTDKPKAIANPARQFRDRATQIAGNLLVDWVGEARAREATGRIAAALSAAAAAAKKPEDFYECTPASVATCIAIAALTGIMPSTGATALAYLVPRSPRKGEQKQLGYMLSHRGLNALAGRCGKVMIAIPISHNDKVRVTEDGGVSVTDRDLDNPPMTAEELRGVVVVVKDIKSGHIVTQGWVPWKILAERRQQSDSYRYALANKWAQDSDPWHKWPIEMAMKAAQHYTISRGWCVIDDTEAVRALSVDVTQSSESNQRPALPAPQTIDDLAGKLAAPQVDLELPENACIPPDRETVTQPKGKKGEPSKKELLDDLPPEMFRGGVTTQGTDARIFGDV
jgi:hypothetical protein